MNCLLQLRGLSSYRCFAPSKRFYEHSHQVRTQLCRRQHSSSPRKPVTISSSNHNQKQDGIPPYLLFGVGVPLVFIPTASIYGYYSCLDNVPYTNRRRFIATSPKFEQKKGDEMYQTFLKQFQGDILPANHRASVTVKRVGSRIAAAAQQCSKEWGVDVHNRIASPFTYTVVRSEEANAFVIPGNHIFVFTGLFRYCHNEDELASVLGHEMAHNLARHSGERMSEGLLLTVISRLALIIDPSGILFTILVPAQTLFYSLPHSREHEVEADQIGVILASEACYDPKAAKRVFSRMKEDVESGGNNNNGGATRPPPEFLSTHPGFDTRLTFFDKWMPGALERFNKDGGNKCRAIRGEMKRARRLAAEMHDRKRT